MHEINNFENKIRELVNHLNRLGKAAELLENAAFMQEEINTSLDNLHSEIDKIKLGIKDITDKNRYIVSQDDRGVLDLYDKFETYNIENNSKISKIKDEIESIKIQLNSTERNNGTQKYPIEDKNIINELELQVSCIKKDTKSIFNEALYLHEQFKKIGIEQTKVINKKIEEIISFSTEESNRQNILWGHFKQQITELQEANQYLNSQLNSLKFQLNWLLYIVGAILFLNFFVVLWEIKSLIFGTL
jgi:hypothetical protein